MASSADVRDIMGLANSSGPQEITKEMILGTDKPKKIYPKKTIFIVISSFQHYILGFT